MSKYNLRFDEAMKRVFEDGLELERDDGHKIKLEKNMLHFSCGPIGWTPYCGVMDIDYILKSKYRVIEKPKRVDIQCEWIEVNLQNRTSSTIVPIDASFPQELHDELRQFVGKRTRVTIEEILE